MKDKILNILSKHSTSLNDPVTGYEKWIHESKWCAVAEEILKYFEPIKFLNDESLLKEMIAFGMVGGIHAKCISGVAATDEEWKEFGETVERVFGENGEKIQNSWARPKNVEAAYLQKQSEQGYLEMFNRIKKSFCEKRNMKFTPTRVVSKPSQLHARLKDYTMDELGQVIYGAFSDNFHIESKWKWVTTSYVTRCETIEKYLV